MKNVPIITPYKYVHIIQLEQYFGGSPLNTSELKKVIEDNYGLDVTELEKIKNVYKIKCKSGDYCLKIIKYDFNHFWFIINAIKYLQFKGFKRVPELIKKKNGDEYLIFDNIHSYLTPWVNARECNYDNPIDLALASYELAELHNKSEGFKVDSIMRPRIGWFKWIDNYEIRTNEILDFKKRIDNKGTKTEFDQLYIEVMEEELIRAKFAVDNLGESDYISIMKKEIEKHGFCHHDYAHHNVLIEADGTVNIIDFDYCILDSHLHDLSSLLLRSMKNGRWDMDTAKYIIDAYGSVKKIEQCDIPVMAAFMEFPQDYWQVGIQYYWEKQPWGEEFFLKKLKKICDDRDEKQEFIEEFRNLKYR